MVHPVRLGTPECVFEGHKGENSSRVLFSGRTRVKSVVAVMVYLPPPGPKSLR